MRVMDQADSSAIVCQCPSERGRQLPRRGEDRTGDLQRGLIPPDGSYVGPSSCNLETELLGSGQRVLSYSYYTPGTELLPDYLLFNDYLIRIMYCVSATIVGRTKERSYLIWL